MGPDGRRSRRQERLVPWHDPGRYSGCWSRPLPKAPRMPRPLVLMPSSCTGAHGYLIDQVLLGTGTQIQRTDEYGGSMENRGALQLEIISAVRDAVGPELPGYFPVFSQWKQQDYSARLAPTSRIFAGSILMRCPTREWIFSIGLAARFLGTPKFDGSPLNLAGWTRRLPASPASSVVRVGLDGGVSGVLWSRPTSRGNCHIDGLLEPLAMEV